MKPPLSILGYQPYDIEQNFTSLCLYTLSIRPSLHLFLVMGYDRTIWHIVFLLIYVNRMHGNILVHLVLIVISMDFASFFRLSSFWIVNLYLKYILLLDHSTMATNIILNVNFDSCRYSITSELWYKINVPACISIPFLGLQILSAHLDKHVILIRGICFVIQSGQSTPTLVRW